ncbi:MAG: hypothetical protein JRG94_19695 [Deltaproteobacteria bacterium]|nr:hypothetical protein [Deltaproteobacteria bacterium]MBW2726497.1 hypothetical protein [Deltaproteobacteria bacterium]
MTMGGTAALSWELLWQYEASLAFGASALGTGRTANSVRLEGVESLEIVDLNQAVYNVAHLFEINPG